MRSAYQYCSRCGDELSHEVRQAYEDNHEGGPVLCRACITEVLKGIPKAFQQAFSAFQRMMNSISAGVQEVENEREI